MYVSLFYSQTYTNPATPGASYENPATPGNFRVDSPHGSYINPFTPGSTWTPLYHSDYTAPSPLANITPSPANSYDSPGMINPLTPGANYGGTCVCVCVCVCACACVCVRACTMCTHECIWGLYNTWTLDSGLDRGLTALRTLINRFHYNQYDCLADLHSLLIQDMPHLNNIYDKRLMKSFHGG